MKGCPWCGVRLSDGAETCPSHRTVEAAAARNPEPADELQGGRWVPDGRGVMRWEAA